MTPFIYHSDHSHGWLEVPLATITSLGLAVSDFTQYSYQSHDGATLYLEEYFDVSVFIKAWERVNERKIVEGQNYVFKDVGGQSFIRQLPSLKGY